MTLDTLKKNSRSVHAAHVGKVHRVVNNVTTETTSGAILSLHALPFVLSLRAHDHRLPFQRFRTWLTWSSSPPPSSSYFRILSLTSSSGSIRSCLAWRSLSRRFIHTTNIRTRTSVGRRGKRRNTVMFDTPSSQPQSATPGMGTSVGGKPAMRLLLYGLFLASH